MTAVHIFRAPGIDLLPGVFFLNGKCPGGMV